MLFSEKPLRLENFLSLDCLEFGENQWKRLPVIWQVVDVILAKLWLFTHCGNDEIIFDVSIFPKDATTPTSKSGWLFSNRWGGHLWCWRPLISQKSLTGFVKLVTTPSGLVVVIRSELVQTSSLETTRFWSLKWRCVQTALSQAFFPDYNT